VPEAVALFRWLPQLAPRIPWVRLGAWPTPIEAIVVDGRPIWVKCEGASSPLYGGNKIRTLEAWLGHAKAEGAAKIWAMGAYGSNHAIATILHAVTKRPCSWSRRPSDRWTSASADEASAG
jgi:1-aminocyclopropane-1-carboxylate deaminase/D-cysteine desulfhydrase-like pyridoxal-dependent ACC family enzyme